MSDSLLQMLAPDMTGAVCAAIELRIDTYIDNNLPKVLPPGVPRHLVKRHMREAMINASALAWGEMSQADKNDRCARQFADDVVALGVGKPTEPNENNLWSVHKPAGFAELLAAAQAALAYDRAIMECANSPARMSSFCTTDGLDLDTLYADWLSKSRTALAITKQATQDTTPTAAKLARLKSTKDAGSYDTWLAVGHELHKLFDGKPDGFAHWVLWSTTAPAYANDWSNLMFMVTKYRNFGTALEG